MFLLPWSSAVRCAPKFGRSITTFSWSSLPVRLRQPVRRSVSVRYASGSGNAGPAAAQKKSNKLLYIGASGIILSVSYLTYQQYNREKVRERQKPKRVVAVKNNDTPNNFGLPKLTLYQFQSCPFCCKVRTFLDYYGISYDKVEVNSVTKEELGFLAYRKVPVLILDDVASAQYARPWSAFPDSSAIITMLYNHLLTGKPISDADGPTPDIQVQDTEAAREALSKQDVYAVPYSASVRKEAAALQRNADEAELEKRWRKWVDEVYVHTISPNIYRTFDESLDTFRQFERIGDWQAHFNAFDRLVIVYLGALVMWLVGGQLKKKHKLDDDVRSSLYAQTGQFLAAVEQANSLRFEQLNRTKQRGVKPIKRDDLLFLGGLEPNLADLAMFAAVSSFDGTLAFANLAQNTNLLNWYEEVKRLVDSHHGRSKMPIANDSGKK